MKFCTQCGSTTELKVPVDDNFERYVCTNCAHTHYLNPRIVCGCIVYKEDKVLLCKRAIKPRMGLWTVPAGFMENGETTRNAAARETQEEANINITTGKLFSISNLPHANQVYFLYLADLGDKSYSVTPESSEIALFSKDDIPWDEIAFHTVKSSLTKYFEGLEDNHESKKNFKLHEVDF
ncbi:MAG: NUDIX hydrolase [Gammaproteobacteria bacterium]|nr:MAG: NUDIX hydrolase [Gammaproteobacteria bacterium]